MVIPITPLDSISNAIYFQLWDIQAAILADDIFKYIFLDENLWISIEIW